MKILKFHGTAPKKAYCTLCFALFACFIIFLALLLSLKSEFIPFSTQVPLYLRKHITKVPPLSEAHSPFVCRGSALDTGAGACRDGWMQ